MDIACACHCAWNALQVSFTRLYLLVIPFLYTFFQSERISAFMDQSQLFYTALFALVIGLAIVSHTTNVGRAQHGRDEHQYHPCS
jgi:hypothetical protein